MSRAALAIALLVGAATQMLLIKSAFLSGRLFVGDAPHARLFTQLTDMYSSVPELVVAAISAFAAVALVEIGKFILLGSPSRRIHAALLTGFQAFLLNESFRYNVPDWYAWVGSLLRGREHVTLMGSRSPFWTLAVTLAAAVSITLLERRGFRTRAPDSSTGRRMVGGSPT